MSRPIGRSSSVRSPVSQTDYSAPAITNDAESFDTALPPMSSKELVVSTRRQQGGLPRLPYPQNLTSIQGGLGGHRRTGSTLKTVMKKIFTRNRRSRTDEMDDPVSDFSFNNSSFPTTQRQKSPKSPSSGSSHQGAQVQQPTATLTTLDVVLKQLDTEPRQRRATLPSLIFSDDESRQALEAVVHPGRRPSNRKLSPHAHSDPDEVRRRRMQNVKRRSRSAGALRVLAKEHHRMSPIQWKRRRSVESTFLESTTCGVGSDSDSSRPPTPSTVGTASTSKPSAQMSASEVEDEVEDEPEDEPVPPILSPNVGELISSMQNDDNASLDQRMTTLEVKLIDLEFAIARMQSGRAETPAESQNQKSSQSPRHKRQKSSAKSKSSGQSPPSSRDDSPDTENLPSAERPLSTSTIRPSPSDIHRARALQAPSMVSLHSSDSGAISVQQYSALVMLLRREQTARRNLEQQVSGLREDIERLTRMAQDSMGVGTMYPIRSVESEEYMRVRPDDSSPVSSPRRIPANLPSPIHIKSDSESMYSRDTADPKPFRPWQPARRIQIANMI
ncbi:uncharacterized protein DSM5745_07089 [Aspergillus mulundensis]|uniref:Uncharacterized protein n=1 Tax=Aspergillus mulundensis TaxID=1810919 RepID=A0A3D8RK46_9EURO|nr:Uncharacterized protein DSM5745_07089 [Aspergillus mulundensis]RDW74427.1 Uncharacterized protein DSM5745_07089 [Aspergillus mulundensis]